MATAKAINILVADDSATMRKVLQMTLSGSEFQVEAVRDVQSLLQSAKDHHPQVIVLDAGMDGYRTTRALREQPASAQVPVILLTHAKQPFDIELGRASGVDDHVSKPFETQALLEKVRACLSRPAARVQPGIAPKEETRPKVAIEPLRPRPSIGSSTAYTEVANKPSSEKRASTLVLSSAPPPKMRHLTDPDQDDEPEISMESLEPSPLPESNDAVRSVSTSPSANTFGGYGRAIPNFGANPGPGANQPFKPRSTVPPRQTPQDFGGAMPARPSGRPVLELAETEASFGPMKADSSEMPGNASDWGERATTRPSARPMMNRVAKQKVDEQIDRMQHRVEAMGLTSEQSAAVLSLSKEVIEKVVWEVVPELAETVIREELRRLIQD